MLQQFMKEKKLFARAASENVHTFFSRLWTGSKLAISMWKLMSFVICDPASKLKRIKYQHYIKYQDNIMFTLQCSVPSLQFGHTDNQLPPHIRILFAPK